MTAARRVAIVTGSASGIGAATAARLLAGGYDVVGVDLEEQAQAPAMASAPELAAATDLAEPVRASAPARLAEQPAVADLGTWTSLAADLTTRAGNRAAVDAALATHGRIDVVVANAGFQHVAPVEEFPEDAWDAMLALLLSSPFLLAKHAWPALRESGDGRVIVVASAHALVASPYKAAYVAAKHGALGLVKTLALEGAEHGIAATALCPGYVRTPLVERQVEAQAQLHDLPPERVLEDVILAPHAVKRLVEPAEVAELAAFVAGPHGRALTGAALPIDQGWTAR